MTRRPLALIAAAALVAGCGSDDKSGPSRAEFISRVDGICTRANARLGEVNRRVSELARTASSVREFVDDLSEGNQIARDELHDIQAVPVPDGAESEMKGVIAARDRQLDAIDEAIAAARANDTAKFNSFAGKVTQAKQAAQKDAQEFGFKVCGRDTSTAPRR